MKSNGFTQYDDFDIEYVRLTTMTDDVYDIKNFMNEFDIYLSITQGSATGVLTVVDGTNLISNLPIIGGEKVEVSWRTKGVNKWKRMTFRVRSIPERVDAERRSTYRLALITDDMYTDNSRITSRGFEGTYTDVVSKVLADVSTLPFEFDQSVGSFTFASPLWSPFKIIEWARSRALDENELPFVFYQDFEGYKFKGLTSLLKAEPTGRFFKQEHGLESDPIKLLYNFSELQWGRNMRDLDDMNDCGCVKNDEVCFNMNDKEFGSVARSYEDFFQTKPNLNGYQVMKDERPYDHQTWHLKTPDSSHKGIYNKKLLGHLLNWNTLKGQTRANSELVLGGVYNFNPPSPEPYTKGDAPHEKFLNGKWLITDIKHSLRPKGSTTTVCLVTDSYTTDIKETTHGR